MRTSLRVGSTLQFSAWIRELVIYQVLGQSSMTLWFAGMVRIFRDMSGGNGQWGLMVIFATETQVCLVGGRYKKVYYDLNSRRMRHLLTYSTESIQYTYRRYQADTKQTPSRHQADTKQTPSRHQADNESGQRQSQRLIICFTRENTWHFRLNLLTNHRPRLRGYLFFRGLYHSHTRIGRFIPANSVVSFVHAFAQWFM
jgi:hypothetical protein